ncbi:MAG: ABC transporter substrate-binding protein [Desulfomonilaceae bacterium]
MLQKAVYFVAIALMTIALFFGPSNPAACGQEPEIKFGVLPVLQALPLFVAQDKGMFRGHGVSVQLTPFNTASEKDIALSTGAIDGYFGDLVTPLVLKGNGRDVIIVAANYDTRRDRRMFAILAKPGGPYKTLADLASTPVAVSSNSVVHFLTETLLAQSGVPHEKITFFEAKNIGMRMQMLLSGQVEAAALPEPLATAAVAKGAKLLGDDAGLGTSQTVLVFNGPFARAHPDRVKAFLKAVGEAAAYINASPDSVRSIMVEHVRLPEPLKQNYPTPRFPQLAPPDQTALETIAKWLSDRKVIQGPVEFGHIVDGSFLQ